MNNYPNCNNFTAINTTKHIIYYYFVKRQVFVRFVSKKSCFKGQSNLQSVKESQNFINSTASMIEISSVSDHFFIVHISDIYYNQSKLLL